jgi:hypothetical protein
MNLVGTIRSPNERAIVRREDEEDSPGRPYHEPTVEEVTASLG